MAAALELASRTPARPWPNPPVGALVVSNGAVVGRGAHHGAGTPHAEVQALAEAGDRARGATLYCTLEPCNHHGRTPPCAPVVAASGVARVVTGVADPNPHVGGGGFDVLRRAGIEVVNGVLAEAALELIWPFVVTRAFERPYVLLKTAASLDGYFAPAPAGKQKGGPHYLTGLAARQDVHRLRRWCDVVLVGSRTAALDRPRLDTRLLDATDPCPASDPLPACVTTHPALVDLFPGRPHAIFTGDWPRENLPAAASTDSPLATVIGCGLSGGRVDLPSLVRRFSQLGCCLMVEGGPTLAAGFLRNGLVDRWVTYTAPVVLGGGVTWPEAAPPGDGGEDAGPAHLAEFTLTRAERCGHDVKAVYDRQSFSETLARLAGQ
jgi:diaminohydroxyphosphoribosylaminopyrimidine deaminase/5-amino-6-(5-phosphoribosylamino)uracil reductase